MNMSNDEKEDVQSSLRKIGDLQVMLRGIVQKDNEIEPACCQECFPMKGHIVAKA